MFLAKGFISYCHFFFFCHVCGPPKRTQNWQVLNTGENWQKELDRNGTHQRNATNLNTWRSGENHGGQDG